MKKMALGISLALLLSLSGMIVHAAATSSAPKKLVTGQIGCLFCYMSKPEGETFKADCSEHCITKRDMPTVLVEEGTGESYVVVWKDGNSPNAKVLPHLATKVNVQGLVYEKKGVRVIEASMIAEAL